MQRRPAQVRIHNHHALAGLGENRGQIEDGGGFAFARAGADDDNGVELVVLAGKQKIGPQDAISFGVLAFRAFVQQVANILRNDAQHGRLERAFHFVNGLNAGIQIFDKEGQTDAHHQTDDHAKNDVQCLVWADGVFTRFSPANRPPPCRCAEFPNRFVRLQSWCPAGCGTPAYFRV